MKRTLTTLAQLAVLGGLTLAGLTMVVILISAVLKIFAFILGEWIYGTLFLLIGGLFILVSIGVIVALVLQDIENTKKEYESPYAREYRLRKEANEKKGN